MEISPLLNNLGDIVIKKANLQKSERKMSSNCWLLSKHISAPMQRHFWLPTHQFFLTITSVQFLMNNLLIFSQGYKIFFLQYSVNSSKIINKNSKNTDRAIIITTCFVLFDIFEYGRNMSNEGILTDRIDPKNIRIRRK